MGCAGGIAEGFGSGCGGGFVVSFLHGLLLANSCSKSNH